MLFNTTMENSSRAYYDTSGGLFWRWLGKLLPYIIPCLFNFCTEKSRIVCSTTLEMFLGGTSYLHHINYLKVPLHEGHPQNYQHWLMSAMNNHLAYNLEVTYPTYLPMVLLLSGREFLNSHQNYHSRMPCAGS